MSFRKIDYKSTDEIWEVKVIDPNTGTVLERWKIQKKDVPKWMDITVKKHGLPIRIKWLSDLDWTRHS